jgi:hypothetical protein
VKAHVGGKLAQIGSRLVDSAAAKLADDFFTRFVEQVRGPAEAAVPAPVPVDQAPSGRRWVRVLAIGVIIAILIYLYASGR